MQVSWLRIRNWLLHVTKLNTSQFKTVCKDDCYYITQQLQQEKSNVLLNSTPHQHLLFVLLPGSSVGERILKIGQHLAM